MQANSDNVLRAGLTDKHVDVDLLSQALDTTGAGVAVIRGVRVHAGLGTGDLSGVFLGANLKLPAGLSLVGELHRGDLNAGLWWSPLRIVRVKAESWDGDLFFGAQVNAPF